MTSPTSFYMPTKTRAKKVNIKQAAMPPPKKARTSTVQSKTRMVKKKAAETAERICPSPPPTSAKRHSAKSTRAQIRQMQQQQVVSDSKLGTLECALQNEKAKLECQKSELAAQKALIDSQTSELETVKAMLEEMTRRVSDLERSHASKACPNAKKRLFEGTATEDPVPRSPMADLSFQGFSASTFNLTLTSTPARASPSHTPTTTQTLPSRTSTPAQALIHQGPSLATRTPVYVIPDISLRTLPSDREETFYRNAFSRDQHHPDVYAASVFMGLVPFQTYSSWVKRCNWSGTNGKMALPVNVKEQVHSLVTQRFPNLSVDQWHKIRSRINERLRFPRKVDPETPIPGFLHQ